MCKYDLAMINRSMHVSHVEHILAETYRSLHEAESFLKIEIDFGKYLRRAAEDPDSTYYQHLEKRIDAIAQALETIKKQINTLVGPNLDSKHRNATFACSLLWIKTSLGEISRALQDTANSRVFRRHRSASALSLFQTKRDSSRIRLSEVHLDYSETLRAVGAIVADYDSRLRDGLLVTEQYKNLAPPIVTIARGTSYCLESFDISMSVPSFVYDEQKLASIVYQDDESKLKDHMNRRLISDPQCIIDYFNALVPFSRIIAPRYHPVMIRYASILAHELFHYIINLVDQLTWFATDNKGRVDLSLLEQHSDIFGPPMIETTKMRQLLAGTLGRFLEQEYLEGEIRLRKFGKQHWELDKNKLEGLLKKRATTYANEILADICGIVLGGEAFLYSMTCDSAIDYLSYFRSEESDGDRKDIFDPSMLFSHHPPRIVRVLIIIKAARQLGYSNACNRALRLLEDIESETSLHEGYVNSTQIWHRWWDLREPESSDQRATAKFMKETIDYLFHQIKKSQLRQACTKDGRIEQDYAEQAYNAICSELDEGSPYVNTKSLHARLPKEVREELRDDFELTASDVMSALWHELLASSKPKPRRRLNWRLFLSKNFGG